jgi:signal transduction histidine kinase
LPQEIELGTFRILQEALQNIEKHASATKVRVTVEKAETELEMEITDNGKGMLTAPGNIGQPDSRQNGLGMSTMRERAIVMGGNLTVSSDDGNGTKIFMRVPL